MAVDRVNLVREGFEAWNSEDPQWVLNHMSPDVEWVAPERDPFPGTYKGFEGVQEFWNRWRNAVGQLKFAAEEVIDGGDHVVVIAFRWARNDITGLQIEDKIAQVFSFDENDKCIRVQEFYDRGAALKARGSNDGFAINRGRYGRPSQVA
jgi:ketosteroid isomerase-like protein